MIEPTPNQFFCRTVLTGWQEEVPDTSMSMPTITDFIFFHRLFRIRILESHKDWSEYLLS
jgi:hypothetical protein